MRQRAHAVAVGNVHIGAARYEDFKYRLVGFDTVPQDDGLKQRRPTKAVDVIDRAASLHQKTHRLHVAMFSRSNQRRTMCLPPYP
jgi:hypothetical protein